MFPNLLIVVPETRNIFKSIHRYSKIDLNVTNKMFDIKMCSNAILLICNLHIRNEHEATSNL